MKRTGICVAFSIALFALPAFGGSPPPSDAVLLTAADIQAKIVGNTIVGKDFKEYYDTSGIIRGHQDGHIGEYHGKWHIEGDKFCAEYPKAPQYDSCNKIAMKGNQVFWLNDDGTTDSPTPDTVETGNAENF